MAFVDQSQKIIMREKRIEFSHNIHHMTCVYLNVYLVLGEDILSKPFLQSLYMHYLCIIITFCIRVPGRLMVQPIASSFHFQSALKEDKNGGFY